MAADDIVVEPHHKGFPLRGVGGSVADLHGMTRGAAVLQRSVTR